MSLVRRLLFVLSLGALLLAAAPAARADDADARAAELKKQGDAAVDALKFAEGLRLYAEAYAISKDPALLYNMGRAHEAMAEYPAALEQLTAFQEKAPPELKARVPGLAQRIADIRAHVSTLVMKTSVSGARVIVDKKEVGVTPLGPLSTNAGRVTLEVIAEGYRPYKRELDLAGGRETVIDVTLLSKGTSGVLVVQSPVAGAEVDVDGKPAGQVPIEVVVTAGAHPVVVRKSGYDPKDTSVVVAVDERKTVSIGLERAAPITAKWWFWTSIGVVVVAGAVTTYALVTERKADTGTYPPGQVAGPLKIAF